MKIAILSCFYPFRGGIAQFNANLFEELGKEHDVRAFNFTRQYPGLLFPGKTQYVTPEDTAVPVEAKALLDTADPFSWGRTARAIRRWDPDVLIVRYWMSWFALSLGHVCAHMEPHCKVIGILDNVIPHERHWFDTPLTRLFLRGLDGAVTLCEEVGGDLKALRPGIPHAVLPHPIYTHFGAKRSPAPRRSASSACPQAAAPSCSSASSANTRGWTSSCRPSTCWTKGTSWSSPASPTAPSTNTGS